MAIGDAFVALVGTAETDRQPASGVFEKVTALSKEGLTDAITWRTASTPIGVINTSVSTIQPSANAASINWAIYNMAIFISNTVFIRKNGTTDLAAWSGVQVNV